MFADKVLLVTGGTGSFGNAVVKRFLSTDISEIRIFSRDEKKQDEMRSALSNTKLKFYIGDVRNYDSVYHAMKDVNYVFHAAALKQVPSCEFYPLEAVRTNILGTDNVINAANVNMVESLILLSTDKAVYPINAMGISKALAEKILVASSRTQRLNETRLVATRYGNVMASRGSVIPLFIDQIKAGRPLTITDPNMTRFLMTLDESIDLVLYAFKHGQQGDIFVQKPPATTIGDLAIGLSELCGIPPNISIIGTRHGEKMHESLVSTEEMLVASDLGSYFRIPADNRDLNYARYTTEGHGSMLNIEGFTSANAKRLNLDELKDLLMKLDSVRELVNV